MGQLGRYAGFAAFGKAAIYIAAFVFFGAYWSYPLNEGLAEKFQYLSDNKFNLQLINFAMYVLFGVLLSVLVVGIYHRQRQQTPLLAQFAALFGCVWVAIIIAAGMVANVGLDSVLQLSRDNPVEAMQLMKTINTIVEGLGGGNEIVGGLWMVLISIAGLKGPVFSQYLNKLGLLIGTAGIASVYPLDFFTQIFGLGQIVWFIWIGVLLLKQQPPLIPQDEQEKSAV